MHPKDKLDVILKALGPVSEPDEDIRQVRARGKKRMNLYPFRPYDIFIKSLEFRWVRDPRQIFGNDWVASRTWFEEPKKISLTSKVRERETYVNNSNNTLRKTERSRKQHKTKK